MSTRLGTQSETYGSLPNITQKETSSEYVEPTNIRSLLRRSVNEAEIRTTTIDDRKLYSSIDHTTPAYTRNPNFWLKGYHRAYTCLTTQTEEAQDNCKLCTAVTPRHAVAAFHSGYAPDVGTTVRFVTEDNVVVERTVVENTRLTVPEGNSDVSMVMFDSDLPDTIVPCKILPASIKNVVHDFYERFIQSWTDRLEQEAVVLVSSDQEYKTHPQFWRGSSAIRSGDWASLTDSVNPSQSYLDQYPDYQKSLDRFRIRGELPIEGDSGNPLFIAVNNQLWLVSVFHTQTSGPLYSDYSQLLNDMIATQDASQGVSTGYTVTEGDIATLR